MSGSEKAALLRGRRAAWFRLRGTRGATVSEFAEAFDLGPQSARRVLERLAAEGLIRRTVLRRNSLIGGGKQVVWVAVKEAA